MDIMGCNMQYIGRDLSAMEMNRKGHMMAAKLHRTGEDTDSC